MECFNQESKKSLSEKKFFVNGHIGNIISDLAMKVRTVRDLNERELGIFNKKLELISDAVEEL